ncbi:MAG: hypothetical protein MZV70_52235 [Desulfobacterales bacterium]|nr:hypothetical protein [Desulfobacterales bacterium]
MKRHARRTEIAVKSLPVLERHDPRGVKEAFNTSYTYIKTTDAVLLPLLDLCGQGPRLYRDQAARPATTASTAGC